MVNVQTLFGYYPDNNIGKLNNSIDNLESRAADGTVKINIKMADGEPLPQEYTKVLNELVKSINDPGASSAKIETCIQDFCTVVDTGGDINITIDFIDKKGMDHQAKINYTNRIFKDDIISYKEADLMEMNEVALSNFNEQMKKFGIEEGDVLRFKYNAETKKNSLIMTSRNPEIIASAFPGKNPRELMKKYPDGIPFSQVNDSFEQIDELINYNKYSGQRKSAVYWSMSGKREEMSFSNDAEGAEYNCYNSALNIGSDQYNKIEFVEQDAAPWMLKKYFNPIKKGEKPIPGKTLIAFSRANIERAELGKGNVGRPDHYATYMFTIKKDGKDYHVVAQKKGGSIYNIELFDGQSDKVQRKYIGGYETYDVDDFYGDSRGWFNPKS